MPYAYSHTGEAYYGGGFATPEEAARAAFRDNPDLRAVWVGEERAVAAHEFVDGESIMDSAMDAAMDACGEVADEWLTHLYRNPEKVAELTKLVGDWLQLNDPPEFCAISDPRLIHREEQEKCQK